MRKLTEIEIQQLVLFRKAGGLTEDGEILYQRVLGGNLSYDEKDDFHVDRSYIEADRDSRRSRWFLK